MTALIRSVAPAEEGVLAAARALRTEAFALSPADAARPHAYPAHEWGAFVGDELVAIAADFEQTAWFGGTPLPAAGFGGVAVMPEHRGGGNAMRLMTAALCGARERGAVVASLFGAAPALYRRLGFGLVATAYGRRIPLSTLGAMRPVVGITLSRAGSADAAEISAFGDALLAHGTGLLARSSAPADEERRTTVARDESGRLVGYADWHTDTGPDGLRVTLDGLEAADARARAALLRSFGTWGSVTDALSVRCTDADPLLQEIPGIAVPDGSVAPAMLRILDVPRAVSERRWNDAVTLTTTFAVSDIALPEAGGAWTLSASNGAATVVASQAAADVTFTADAFAQWFSGVSTTTELRSRGLVDGEHSALDALATAPAPLVNAFF